MNMIEQILKIVHGIVFMFLLILPFFVVPIIGVKVYLKIRAVREKTRLESRTEKEPLQSANRRRTVFMFIGITLLIIIFGLMTGFTIGVISNLIPIVFLFPVIMGINSGKMTVGVLKRAKFRKFGQLILLSLLSAVTMYGAYHYSRYLGFQVQTSVEIFSGLDEATDEENLQASQAFLDYALEKETGHSGFVGYMLYTANQGMSISRLSRSNGFNLGPALTWLYWALEFGLILGITLYKGRKQISAAFCEACGNWYGTEKHLGGMSSANQPFLLDLIKQRDFTRLGNLIEKNAELPSLEVYFKGCEVCGKSQSQLVVRHAFQGPQGRFQFNDVSATVLYPSESMSLLNQLRPDGTSL